MTRNFRQILGRLQKLTFHDQSGIVQGVGRVGSPRKGVPQHRVDDRQPARRETPGIFCRYWCQQFSAVRKSLPFLCACVRVFGSCRSMNLPPPIPQQRGSGESLKTSQSPGPSGSKTIDSRNSSITNSSSGSSTNNANGQALLNNRLRSLLSHDLALPLFHALHGSDPGTQKYLAKEISSIPDDCGDSIFEEAVTTWVSRQQRTEQQLTHSINELINKVSEQTLLQSENNVEVKTICNSQQEAHVQGRIDILLSSSSNNNDSPSTPVALIKVGRKNKEWWKELDRAGKCLDIMEDGNMDERLKFQDAMLCAILTLEGEGNTQEFISQFGVFLCWPNSGKRFRMTLLWKARALDLSAASKDFGRFLRVVSSFAVWIKDDPEVGYVYLSSNVCRVGNTVRWLPRCCSTLRLFTLLIMSSCFHSFYTISTGTDTSEL